MCYTVPLVTSVITTVYWSRRKERRIWWLNLMLYGGALFGVIDHLWNGELFLISDNLVKDLALGCVITAAIFISWGLILRLTTVAKSAQIESVPTKGNEIM